MSKPMSTRQTKRTKKTATLVAVWVPNDLLSQLDATAIARDSDRSKVIRHALRNLTQRPA